MIDENLLAEVGGNFIKQFEISEGISFSKTLNNGYRKPRKHAEKITAI